MKVNFLQKGLSFYLTGQSVSNSFIRKERNPTCLTDQELDDLETTKDAYNESLAKSNNFENPALNLNADFNTSHGQFRMAGLGVINSLFSGIGAGIASKMNFISGFLLACGSIFLSTFKDLPFLSKKFSILSFGGNLIRGPLHIFDSIFSRIGELGSKSHLASILSGIGSLISLKRVIQGNDNKSFELPFDTVSGTLGRTALHHVESMLASKASKISASNENTSAFLASSLTTLGLLLPDNIKKKKLPWNTFEGFFAQGGSHFIDSLFSNIGNIFGKGKALLPFLAGLPALGLIPGLVNYQIPFGTLEGRLARSIFHTGENLVFNLGTTLGDTVWGLPLSLAFGGLTYFSCFNKNTKNILKNIPISRDKVGGLLTRLPFDFIYSTISQTALKLSKYIPAPLLTLLGPALSFQIGEKFKNIDAKFDDLKGLMIRNSVHFLETILSRSAYTTGRMITNTQDKVTNAGSILADGRWLNEEGRIVPTMAIGKQIHEEKEKNIFHVLLSAVAGIALSLCIFLIGKKSSKDNIHVLSNESIENRQLPIGNQNRNTKIENQKLIRRCDVIACYK